MSQIADLGVNFKMTGANEFESRLKSLESQWKGFAGAMDKAPAFNHHFDKMGAAAEHAGKRISSAMAVTKAAIIGVLTAKAGSGLFDWALGNKAVAEAKSSTSQFVNANDMQAYESSMSRIRNMHEFAKDDLYKGAYQIDSAMSGKPLEEKVKVFEDIAYYAKLTGKSFEDASKLYKQFLSSFGNTLPLEKQKTFAADTLGMLFKIGQISSSDPQQVADAVGQAAQTYSQFGMSQARMFAEISAITPMLGGKPEMAATGLRSLYPEAGDAAGKLAAAAYEQAFAKGQVADDRGARSRNWGSLEHLKDAAAEKNKQAIEDLAEMKRNSERFASKTSVGIEDLIKGGDIDGMWKRMGDLVKQNESNPERAKILKDAFGLERMNVALGLIGMYQRGEIQKLQKEYEKATGQEAKDARDRADEGSLPHKMGILTQKAEDLSSVVKGIFYEPMKALLEEWKSVFEKIEKDFAGETGLKKIQGISGNLMSGIRSGWNDGKPVPEDNRSVAQMFQDFVSGMGQEEWKTAGQKIGTAASDFVAIMGQLKEIVSAVHGGLSSLGLIKPLAKAGAAALLTPGPPAVKAAAGVGVLGYEGLKAMKLPEGGPLDERGLWYPTPMPMEKKTAPDLMVPAHGRSSMVVPPDNLQSAHTPTGETGSPITIIQKHENIVQLDGREIAREVAPEVKEMIDAEKDRNRSNANDDGIRQ